MTAIAVGVSPEWLALRAPADAAARSGELAEILARHLPATGRLVVHDLGGGSGAMGRWLSPRLPRPQHWVVHDRDADLLKLAEGPFETRRSDITRLTRDDLAGASVVTASALLDLLTAEELDRMLGACAGLPLLLALTVVGRVSMRPAEPLDAQIGAAFDDHQRRGDRLGPDAVAAAVDAVEAEVLVRPSPWHLGADHGDLTAGWLRGWVDAACEQEPGLVAEAGPYRDRRLAQLAAGGLSVTVEHADLLVLP
jgi:hypothetical protein